MADNLAAKYRPTKLEDLTEQILVADIVRKMCESKNITNRNFLFIGPAGTGKTTTAKIIGNMLNGSSENCIEIDAASYNGVDAMRDIMNQARSYPVGTDYKIFIVDECFPGDSLIRTTSGLVPIKDIRPGDRIYNLTGQATVSHVFQNSVKTANLIYLGLSGEGIVTTRDHLFFTDEGWVAAQDLKEGDILYDYKTMQDMQSRISSSLSQRRKDVLQHRMQESSNVSDDERKEILKFTKNMSDMWDEFLDSKICRCTDVWKDLRDRVAEATSGLSEIGRNTFKALAYVYLSCMQSNNGDKEQRQEESVFDTVFWKAGIAESTSRAKEISDKAVRELWKYVSSQLCRSQSEDMQSRMQNRTDCMEVCSSSSLDLSRDVRKNEASQSVAESGINKEDASYKESKWNIDSEECYEMWKRILLQASDSFEERIGRGVDIRVSCKDTPTEDKSDALSYELQTRPRLARIEARNRGGWDRPQYEIATVARRKEGQATGVVRVDSVAVYQRGHNDELFQSSFPDTKICDAEYVTMYDLEVEGHPSYYVNNVLVHNCHALSANAWQVALKTIEEQPAKSIFIWATTNPEKIPATILSRVQTFQLSKISLDGIYNRLVYIIDQETAEGRNITYEPEAVRYIAKLANGGMRDAITLLDKSLSYSEAVTQDNIQAALGLPSYDDYFALLNAVAKKDNAKITEIINNVYNSGVNFCKWFEGFFSFVTNIVKYIYLQDINQTMIPSTYQDKISGYSTAHAALCLKLSNKLVKMNQELKSTQYLQELAISYLCTPPERKKA